MQGSSIDRVLFHRDPTGMAALRPECLEEEMSEPFLVRKPKCMVPVQVVSELDLIRVSNLLPSCGSLVEQELWVTE